MWRWRLFKRILLVFLVLCTSISLVLYLFEDKIIRKVVEQANTYLKVPVNVDQISVHFWRTFPRISVAFERVQIADPLQKKDTLLALDQISLRFNPFDLLSGNYHIEQIAASNGALSIRENAKGKVNYDIFKSTKSGTSDFDIALNSIFLEQIQLKYRGPKNSYFLRALIESSTISGRFSATKTTLKTMGNVRIQRIQKDHITLLQNDPLDFDIPLLVDQNKGTVEIPQARIQIAELPFLLDAQFGPQNNSLDIRSQHLSLKQFLHKVSPLKARSLKKLKVDGRVDFQLHYQQNLEDAAQIAAYFSIKDGQLIEPKFGTKVKHLQLYGTYKNLPIDLLQIERFTFDSQAAQFNGQLQLANFAAPKMILQANGNIPLAMIQALYPIPHLESVTGHAQLQLTTELQTNAAQEWQMKKLRGAAQIRASQLKMQDLRKSFSAVSGAVSFTNDAIQISDCSAQIGRSDFRAQFYFPNFKDLFEVGPVEMSGKLWSNNFDISDLESKEGSGATTNSSHSSRTWMLPTTIKGDLPFTVQNLSAGKMRYKNLDGLLRIRPQQLAIDQLRMQHADGNWKGTLQIQETAAALFTLHTSGNVAHLDLKRFFTEWDNFDQTVLRSDQLSGKGQLDFDIFTQFDYYKGLDEASLIAKVNCQIDEGRLYHAPILQDLANTLTISEGRAILGTKNQVALKQKLLDVRFETLRNTFVISDRKLRFDKMHIASDVLDIDLVGQHSFDHLIDYAVALRLRDLVVQETQTAFGEIIDDGTGLRLFVRCSGPLDDPKVTWDRNGKKEAAKARFEQSQAESKAMLKTAFGAYQNDPTVQQYEQKTAPHETIRMNFDASKPTKTSTKETTAPKNSKLQQRIEKWKQEQQPTSEVKVRIGG